MTKQDLKIGVSAYAERKAKRFVFGLDKYFGQYSKVGNQAFYDPSAFPRVAKVEAEWKGIRAELDEFLAHYDALQNFQDLSPDQRNLTQDNRWKTVFFYARVVLFVDFVRPLRLPASLCNSLLLWLIAISPFVLGAAGRELAWEKPFEHIVNAKK